MLIHIFFMRMFFSTFFQLGWTSLPPSLPPSFLRPFNLYSASAFKPRHPSSVWLPTYEAQILQNVQRIGIKYIFDTNTSIYVENTCQMREMKYLNLLFIYFYFRTPVSPSRYVRGHTNYDIFFFCMILIFQPQPILKFLILKSNLIAQKKKKFKKQKCKTNKP